MNAIETARHSIACLAALLHLTVVARAGVDTRAESPSVARCYLTQLYVTGSGMVRVLEIGTGRVLGFRRTLREARALADRLERGEHLQAA